MAKKKLKKKPLGKKKNVKKAKKLLSKAVKKVAKKAAKKTAKKVAKKAASPKKKTVVSTLLNVGQAAPAFSMQSDGGQTVSLSDFLGKRVVLYFYPKDDTPGCTQESCDFRDNIARVLGHGAVVLGVSKDSVESHQKFKAKYSLPFPLLSDESGAVCEAYGVWKEKSMYGKKYMGIERMTFIIGSDGKIAKIYPKVKVEGHVDQVIQDLDTVS